MVVLALREFPETEASLVRPYRPDPKEF